MIYRFLTREEMVGVTISLVDRSHDDYRAIMSYPLAAALWELVVAAHERVLRTQRFGPSPERLIEISELLAGLDLRHDDVLRGIFYMLLALEYLAATPELKAGFHKLRVKMFPEQLQATRKSYRGQVGQAALVRSRLTDSDRALLGSVMTSESSTLMDSVDEWFQVAEAMGELENERAAGDESTPSAAEALDARNGWGRAVDAFVSTLRLRDDVPREIAVILDRIEATSLQASRRYARGTRSPVEGDDGELPEDAPDDVIDEADGSSGDIDDSELPGNADGGIDQGELPDDVAAPETD